MADFQNFGELVGQYNATLPTLSEAQANPLQLDVNGRLLVQADVAVVLDHANDSVKVGDGTDFLAVNADGSLNITDNGGSLTVDGTVAVSSISGTVAVTQSTTPWVIGDGAGSITVDAVNLDIRDLTHVSDSVQIGDGTDLLAVNADGSINVTVNNASIAVTATNLDIRDLSAAQDNVAISDGTDTLAVNADGSINSVVTATNLDIRDLTHVSDSIKVGDGTDFLAINADGSINVAVAGGGTEADAASDSGSGGDGLVALTAGPDTIVSIAHTSGTYKIHGFNWSSDRQCTFRLEVRDAGVLVETVRVLLNSGSIPADSMYFNKPIEIAGAATRVIRVTATRASGANGSASAAINGETI
jgi:hypothetical protein